MSSGSKLLEGCMFGKDGVCCWKGAHVELRLSAFTLTAPHLADLTSLLAALFHRWDRARTLKLSKDLSPDDSSKGPSLTPADYRTPLELACVASSSSLLTALVSSDSTTLG